MISISNSFNSSNFFLKKVDLPALEINKTLSKKITKLEINKILKDQHITAKTIKKNPYSSLHAVYIITTTKEKIILRINPSKRIEYQFYLDSIIPQITDNSQKKYYVDLTRSIVPYDFELIWTYPGKDLYNDTRLGTLSMSALTKAGYKLFLIHQNKGRLFGPLKISYLKEGRKLYGTVDSWDKFFYRNLKMHISYCKKNKLINSSQANKINEIFEQNRSFIKSIKKSYLVHGDVCHPNMYVTARGIQYIDFEDTFLGDPYYDLAFYATGCYGNEKWMNAFLKGYTHDKKLDKNYLKRFSLYYLRATLIKTISRHKFNKVNKGAFFDFTDRLDYAIENCRSLV